METKQFDLTQWQIDYISYVADNYPIIDAEACEFADGVE